MSPACAGVPAVLHVVCNGVPALYKVDQCSVLLDGCVEFTPITFEEITGERQPRCTVMTLELHSRYHKDTWLPLVVPQVCD